MKLLPLLAMLEALALSELLDEFGQSDEAVRKIKAALSRTRQKAPAYMVAVFSDDEPVISGDRK